MTSQLDIEQQSIFKCPACHFEMAYGQKKCENCQTAIYYRDLSETFWNDRKKKMFKQSSAISKLK